LVLFFSSLVYSEEVYETRLFFGRDIKTSSDYEETYVTDDMWNEFMDEIVAKSFDGFTVMDAVGYWQGARENSKIILFIYPNDEEAESNLEKINLIARNYAIKFHQEAVMKTNEIDKGAIHRDFIAPK